MRINKEVLLFCQLYQFRRIIQEISCLVEDLKTRLKISQDTYKQCISLFYLYLSVD